MFESSIISLTLVFLLMAIRGTLGNSFLRSASLLMSSLQSFLFSGLNNPSLSLCVMTNSVFPGLADMLLSSLTVECGCPASGLVLTGRLWLTPLVSAVSS